MKDSMKIFQEVKDSIKNEVYDKVPELYQKYAYYSVESAYYVQQSKEYYMSFIFDFLRFSTNIGYHSFLKEYEEVYTNKGLSGESLFLGEMMRVFRRFLFFIKGKTPEELRALHAIHTL